jgi:hypothetical protein
MLCPVSFAPAWMFVMSPRWNCGLGMFALVHVASSISENAVMIMRNMTGDKLSPCRTPTVCATVAFSFPIFRVTVRSV